MGLEPTRDKLPTDFKSVASADFATTPKKMEVPIGFEPMITELQSIALPLGYGTNCLVIMPRHPVKINTFCKKNLFSFKSGKNIQF